VRHLSVPEMAVRILKGYARVLRRALVIIALLFATLVAAAAIVFPLWYLSTKLRPLYTTVVLLMCVAGLVYLVVRKAIAFMGYPAHIRARKLTSAAARLAGIVLALALLYVIVGLYVYQLLAVAIPLSIIYLVVLGYLLYVRRSPSHRQS